MERILHFTTGPTPSPEQLTCIQLARDLHPAWRILVWTDPVQEAAFRLRPFYERALTGAGRADLIRLDAIENFGGIYLDADIRLVRSLDNLASLDHFFCSEDGRLLTNAAFGASAGHPIVKHLIERLLTNEPDWDRPPNEITGPKFFARELQWWPKLQLLPRTTFYPYNWDEPVRGPNPTTLGVHQWAGSWKQESAKASRHSLNTIRNTAAEMAKTVSVKTKATADKFAKRLLKNVPDSHSLWAYSSTDELIARTSRGLTMSLPGRDLSVTPHIALTGTYEESELRFIERNVCGGDFVVDVGANIGVHSLVAARVVGPFGRVFCFEPNPYPLKHLRRSARLNWFHDRMHLDQRAISDQCGQRVLTYMPSSLGDGSLAPSEDSTLARSAELLGESETATVDCTTLDDEVRTGIEISLLKIDVGGLEHAVLRGGKRLLSNRSVAVIMLELAHEVAPSRYDETLAAIREVEGYGYVSYALGRDGSLASRCLPLARTTSRNIVMVRTP